MKKYVTKAAIVGVLSTLVSTSIAQEKNLESLKQGEVKVMIIKDENGKVSEVNKTFSVEDKEKVNALLKKEGVEWNLEELEREALDSQERSGVKMEVEVEKDGEAPQKDVRIVRLKNGNKKTKETLFRKIIFETEDGEQITLEDLNQKIDMNKDGQKKVYQTMVLFTDKNHKALNKDSIDELPGRIKENKLNNMPIQDLELFPNPTNGNFSMRFKTESPTDIELSRASLNST